MRNSWPQSAQRARKTVGEDVLGRAAEVRTEYYAISIERKLSHPCVLTITASACSPFLPGEE